MKREELGKLIKVIHVMEALALNAKTDKERDELMQIIDVQGKAIEEIHEAIVKRETEEMAAAQEKPN